MNRKLGWLKRVLIGESRELSDHKLFHKISLIALFGVIVLIVAGVVWLNVAAEAQINASAALTVYQQSASVAHKGADFAAAATGTVIDAGDSVKTDVKGRAAITLPDGTITRLASETTIRLDSEQSSTSSSAD